MYVPPPFSTSSLNPILPSLKLSKKEPNQSNCLHLALAAIKCQTLQRELQHLHPPSLQSRKTATKRPKMYQKTESIPYTSWRSLLANKGGKNPPQLLHIPLCHLWICFTCIHLSQNVSARVARWQCCDWWRNLCDVPKSSMYQHFTRTWDIVTYIESFLVRGWNAFNELQPLDGSPADSAEKPQVPPGHCYGINRLTPPWFLLEQHNTSFDFDFFFPPLIFDCISSSLLHTHRIAGTIQRGETSCPRFLWDRF